MRVTRVPYALAASKGAAGAARRRRAWQRALARTWLASVTFALASGGLCVTGAAQPVVSAHETHEPAGAPAHGKPDKSGQRDNAATPRAGANAKASKAGSRAAASAHASSGNARAATRASSGATPGASSANARAYLGAGRADTVDYVTQPGDSLYDIASRYLRDTRDWAAVARIDKVTLPRRLQPGTTLHLPVALLRQVSLNGKVVAASGPVSLAHRGGAFVPLVIGANVASGVGNAAGAGNVGSANRPNRVGNTNTGDDSNASTTLAEGDQIQTGKEGFATLELPDGSHLVVRPDSLLEVSVLRRTVLTGAFDRVISLRRGEVRNEVTRATKKDDRFQIRSPSVVAGVRGTDFRVHYDENGATAIEVLEGAVGVGGIGGAGNAGNSDGADARRDVAASGRPDDAQLVRARHGSVTGADGRIGVPRDLLDAPGLIRSSRVQDEADLLFDVKPLAGARYYRVLVGRDAGLLDPVREATSDGTHVVVTGPLEDGTYFARASAVDADGLEGMPGTYAFERRRMTLSASAAAIAGTHNYAFRWQIGEAQKAGKTRFRFVLAATQDLRAPLVDRPDLPGSDLSVSNLPPGTYYWTVVAEQFDHGQLYEKSGAVQSFKIER